MFRTRRSVYRLCLGLLLGVAIAGCEPRVEVAAPEKPITINLNIKLDAEVRLKLEDAAKKDIKKNPEIF